MMSNDPRDAEDFFRNTFKDPSQLDQYVRNVFLICRMMLPENKRTKDEVESQVRRVFERAIKNYREDADAFQME